MGSDINTSYERFYAERAGQRVYPTEFVVRTFLARYPHLSFPKPGPGSRVLDVAFGDGRNTVFLAERGYNVSGIEITQGIVDRGKARMAALGHDVDLRVGRNSSIPYPDGEFDCIVACACIYYCDEGQTMRDNLAEYARAMRRGGWLVASVADTKSYIFNGAKRLEDGSFQIANDPYNNRVGYRLHAFATSEDLKVYLSPHFTDFSIGHSNNDYYGVNERLHWVVCRKR
jgi:ubiquinone/menaquinone biosynthesis C-methylase UbiE